MPLRGKDAFKKRLVAKSGQFCRALALETHGRLIRRTPVDKGRARNNWNVAIGDIDRANDRGEDTSGRGAMTEGLTTIAEFGPGKRLFNTNSVPYIGALEDGSSKQAPGGMVKITAAEIRPIAAQAARTVRQAAREVIGGA